MFRNVIFFEQSYISSIIFIRSFYLLASIPVDQFYTDRKQTNNKKKN
ncbi:hypothetical protein M153_15700013796 [Pseudoloma neurophilia]|uniref:Uncharacterized protein n=1 Tax=Pseudoloma neurophilia TaxID=146866 RepID=A0A0R0M6Q0_9MICR|nr:hypothetical protein M153_15700013796 [Pseudoloma neurophilia]